MGGGRGGGGGGLCSSWPFSAGEQSWGKTGYSITAPCSLCSLCPLCGGNIAWDLGAKPLTLPLLQPHQYNLLHFSRPSFPPDHIGPPPPPHLCYSLFEMGGGGGGGMIRVKQQATCASKNGAPVFKSLSGLVRKGLEGKREGCLLLNDYYKNCYRQRLLSWLPSDCLFLTFRSSMKPFQSQVHYLYHLLLTVFMQLTQTATVIFST